MATSTDLLAAIEEIQGGLRPEGEKVDLEEALARAKETWTGKLGNRIGVLPWWVISSVIHGVLLLLASLLAVAVPRPPEEQVFIVSPPAPAPEVKYERRKRPAFEPSRNIFNPADENIPRPKLDRKESERDETRDLDLPDERSARGELRAIGDVPLGREGLCSTIALGPGLAGNCFGYGRRGGRAALARRGGGGKDTEGAVNRALEWLARHQEPGGRWDTVKLEAAKACDNAVTGLALLAFVSAGHSEKSGKYRDNVRRAVNWLISQQKENGCIYDRARDRLGYGPGYTHAIAGLALVEAYGMGKSRRTRRAAQKAVDYSVNVHQRPYGGWRYAARSRNSDLSVTGWFVMQLKSARVAKLKVDGTGFQGAIAFLDEVHGTDGKGYYRPAGSQHHWTPTTTAIAMVCRQFLGTRASDPRLVASAGILAAPGRLPEWGEHRSLYYWYYATLGMFQMGGGSWPVWNKAMKKALLENQRTGGDEDGSWDPCRERGSRPGRAYSTAMGALCLEVYYRYLQMSPR